MTYDEFIKTICSRIEAMLPPGTSIQLQKIYKNNGLKLDGITISTSQSNLSPTIFLNRYYEKHTCFPDFEAICRDILLTYEHTKSTEYLDVGFFTDYSLVKDQLAYRLINYEKNKELLQSVPHIRYLDLAIVFYCLLQITEKNNATILIHNQHLKPWHITVDELYLQTVRTTPLLLPYEFRSLSKVLTEAFGETIPLSGMEHTLAPHPFHQMYVLTNCHKLYGAGCILYPHLLSQLSDTLQADLFILPSSIHEVIVLPAAGSGHSKDLTAIVNDINQSELSIDEVLSSHVYYFSRADRLLRMCI